MEHQSKVGIFIFCVIFFFCRRTLTCAVRKHWTWSLMAPSRYSGTDRMLCWWSIKKEINLVAKSSSKSHSTALPRTQDENVWTIWKSNEKTQSGPYFEKVHMDGMHSASLSPHFMPLAYSETDFLFIFGSKFNKVQATVHTSFCEPHVQKYSQPLPWVQLFKMSVFWLMQMVVKKQKKDSYIILDHLTQSSDSQTTIDKDGGCWDENTIKISGLMRQRLNYLAETMNLLRCANKAQQHLDLDRPNFIFLSKSAAMSVFPLTNVRVPMAGWSGGISTFWLMRDIILIRSCNFLREAGGRRSVHNCRASMATRSLWGWRSPKRRRSERQICHSVALEIEFMQGKVKGKTCKTSFDLLARVLLCCSHKWRNPDENIRKKHKAPHSSCKNFNGWVDGWQSD